MPFPAASSIFVFEMNKKFLMHKILTKQLEVALSADILKTFDQKYEELSTESADNLLYQYFSPLISSFEISRDINYVYEYASFGRHQHLIRFSLHKNCLIFCIYDATNKPESKSELATLMHAEYYSSWYSKSFLSLLKHKFGVCSDEKCFSKPNQRDLERLYLKWSSLYSRDQIYFVEALEQLDLNEDIKIKCDLFMQELVEFLMDTELVMSEFDYEAVSKITNLDEEDDDSGSYSNPVDESPVNLINKAKFNEVESFFNDLALIDQFILSYGSKILYKYKYEHATSDLNENAVRSSFSIDSSSIFMILLEIADFIDSDQSIVEAESDDEGSNENETFKSASASPDGRQEAFSTPLIAYESLAEHIKSNNDKNGSSLEKNKVNYTKIKKTHGFLNETNKSTGFYDILYLKLDEHLCLTMIKSNKLNKYCQLITDFDAVIEDFLDLLNRKRLEISSAEINSSLQSVGGAGLETVSPISQPRAGSAVNTSSANNFGDKFDKAFLSFFINKLIIFYEKLTGLKSDLMSQTRSETNAVSKDNFLTRRFKYNGAKKSGRNADKSAAKFDEHKKALDKIDSLQTKINKLTNSKQFKQFIGYINNENSSGGLHFIVIKLNKFCCIKIYLIIIILNKIKRHHTYFLIIRSKFLDKI